MASLVAGLASAIFEIDEIEASKHGDEVYYTFVTTGVRPNLAQIKTKLWALLAPPVKRLEVLAIEPIEEGPITKRYKIHVKGKVIGKTLGEKKYRVLSLKKPKKRKTKRRG